MSDVSLIPDALELDLSVMLHMTCIYKVEVNLEVDLMIDLIQTSHCLVMIVILDIEPRSTRDPDPSSTCDRLSVHQLSPSCYLVSRTHE